MTIDESRTGAQRIADERKRQIKKLNWTPEHDDEHDAGELALAAACYAAQAGLKRIYVKDDHESGLCFDDPWPFATDDYDARHRVGQDNQTIAPYPLDEHHRIRLLEKAGAFIAAEIDRLVRERAGCAMDEQEREVST